MVFDARASDPRFSTGGGKMKKMFLVLAFVVLFGNAVALSAPVTARAQSIPVYTMANNGQSTSLNLGEQFVINLGTGYDWTVKVSDPYGRTPVVLMLNWQNSGFSGTDSMGLFQAVGLGRARITAYGVPKCSTSSNCRLPAQTFTLNVIVPTTYAQ
jgi:hypothetical protein